LSVDELACFAVGGIVAERSLSFDPLSHGTLKPRIAFSIFG
jgi:hypothetical protein